MNWAQRLNGRSPIEVHGLAFLFDSVVPADMDSPSAVRDSEAH